MEKRVSIYRKLVIVITCAAIGVLLLLPIEIIGRYKLRLLIVAAGIFLSVATLFAISGKKEQAEYRYAVCYLIPYTAVIAFTFFYSWIRYNYGLGSLVKFMTHYLYVFMAIPIIYIFHYDRGCKKFLRLLTGIVMLMLLLRFASWYLYNYRGITVFGRLLFQYKEWTRDGVQRIEAGMLYGVALVYCSIYAWKGNRRLLYKCFLLFMIAFLVLATKVRFQTAVSLLTILVVYCFREPKLGDYAALRRAALLIAVVILVFATGIVGRVVSLVSVSGQYGAQTLVRIQGIAHYFSLMADQHAFLGLGFLDNDYPEVKEMMARTIRSPYYLDDIGVFGGIAQFGLLALFLFGVLYFQAIRVCYKCYRNKSNRYFALMMGITTYMIVSSLLLNPFDVQRSFDVPLYIAIISYVNAHAEDDKIKIFILS